MAYRLRSCDHSQVPRCVGRRSSPAACHARSALPWCHHGDALDQLTQGDCPVAFMPAAGSSSAIIFGSVATRGQSRGGAVRIGKRAALVPAFAETDGSRAVRGRDPRSRALRGAQLACGRWRRRSPALVRTWRPTITFRAPTSAEQANVLEGARDADPSNLMRRFHVEGLAIEGELAFVDLIQARERIEEGWSCQHHLARMRPKMELRELPSTR